MLPFPNKEIFTFIRVFVVDAQVEVATITKLASVYDLALQLKNTDTCSIKGNSGWFFL